MNFLLLYTILPQHTYGRIAFHTCGSIEQSRKSRRSIEQHSKQTKRVAISIKIRKLQYLEQKTQISPNRSERSSRLTEIHLEDWLGNRPSKYSEIWHPSLRRFVICSLIDENKRKHFKKKCKELSPMIITPIMNLNKVPY